MLKEKSDIELLDLYIAKKERKALSELFLRHADIAFRTAMRVTKNAADAEDVVQIAFIELIKNIQHFRQEGTFLSWFLKIVSHRSIDQLRSDKRRAKRESQAIQQVYYEDKPLETEETQKKIVENHLLHLPSIYREPIYMKIVEGMSTGEISKLLSKPEKTIRTQISRGLEQLRVSLKSSGTVLTIPVITMILSNIELQAAPKSLTNHSNIDKLANQIELNGELLPSHFASILKAASVILSIAAVSFFLYFQLSQPRQNLVSLQDQPSTVPIDVQNTEKASREKKVFYTGFEDEESLRIFSIHRGSIQIVKNGGVHQSHGALTAPYTILSIDISQFRLPVKISCDYDIFLPKPNEVSGTTFELYQPDSMASAMYLFVNIGNIEITPYVENQRYSQYSNKWSKQELYLFENRLENWKNGELTGIMFLHPANQLIMAKVSQTYLDNFKIEEIDAKYSSLGEKKTKMLQKLFEETASQNYPFGIHKTSNPLIRKIFSKNIEFTKFRYRDLIHAFDAQTVK